MLPGNMQYWRPEGGRGAKEIEIDEPIYFAGPTPESLLKEATDHLATQQFEKKDV